MRILKLDNNQGEISVISGKVNGVNEPSVSYVPFVMNTIEEIYQAYEDFKNNKFGSVEF